MTSSRTRRPKQPKLSSQDQAYNAGFDGQSASDAVLADPELLTKFELGKKHAAENAAPAVPPPPAPAEPPSPDSTPPTKPKSGKAGGGGRSRKRSNNSMFRPVRITPGPVPVPTGDAGGVLLAVVCYPIALSILRYGAAGPGMWFRAKFLNQASGDKATAAAERDRKNAQRPDPKKKSLEKPVPPGFDGTYTGSGGIPVPGSF